MCLNTARYKKPDDISEQKWDRVLTVSLAHLNKTNTSIWAFSILVKIIFSLIFIHEIAPYSIFLMSFLLCLTITFILCIFSLRHLNGLVWHFQSSFFFLPKTELELKIVDSKKRKKWGLHKPAPSQIFQNRIANLSITGITMQLKLPKLSAGSKY